MEKTAVRFNSLAPKDKWSMAHRIKGAVWVCGGCGEKITRPRRCSPFAGASIHCSECDFMLTRRTGGGQNDPFNWKLQRAKP